MGKQTKTELPANELPFSHDDTLDLVRRLNREIAALKLWRELADDANSLRHWEGVRICQEVEPMTLLKWREEARRDPNTS